jgi:hypothetical protein
VTVGVRLILLGGVLFIAAVGCFAWPHLTKRWPPLFSDPKTVPLIEAATRAYEKTRGTLAAEAAERNGGTVITWCCWALWPKLTIYGSWPPSRLPEVVSWDLRNRYSFELVDGQVGLESRVEQGRFGNLHVDVGELRAAIEALKRLGRSGDSLWG